MIVVLDVYHRKDFEQINPMKMQEQMVRSQNGTVRALLESVNIIVPCAGAIMGSLFALASRAPLPRLKQKVTMKQLSPVGLSALALTIIATEVTARCSPVQKATDNRSNALLKITAISILAILVGTVTYRAGLIFKKPL